MKMLMLGSHKNSNSTKTKSIFHHFFPDLQVSLTLCPINPVNGQLNPIYRLLALLGLTIFSTLAGQGLSSAVSCPRWFLSVGSRMVQSRSTS